MTNLGDVRCVQDKELNNAVAREIRNQGLLEDGWCADNPMTRFDAYGCVVFSFIRRTTPTIQEQLTRLETLRALFRSVEFDFHQYGVTGPASKILVRWRTVGSQGWFRGPLRLDGFKSARVEPATGLATCALCEEVIDEGTKQVSIVINSRATPNFHPDCLADLGAAAIAVDPMGEQG